MVTEISALFILDDICLKDKHFKTLSYQALGKLLILQNLQAFSHLWGDYKNQWYRYLALRVSPILKVLDSILLSIRLHVMNIYYKDIGDMVLTLCNVSLTFSYQILTEKFLSSFGCLCPCPLTCFGQGNVTIIIWTKI